MSDDLKRKLANIIHNSLLHCEVRPFNGGTYSETAEQIADDIISQFKSMQKIWIDATALAIAEASKAAAKLQKTELRALTAERALYNLAKEFVDMQGYEKWDIAILAKEIVVPDYIKQAEKELTTENRNERKEYD